LTACFCAAAIEVFSMRSRLRPTAWIFSNGRRLDFNVGGYRHVAALVGRTAHAAPSAMPVLGSMMILDGTYFV
jgi:hypothetical protein